MPYRAWRPGLFKVRDLVADTSTDRTGTIIAFADDADVALVRWTGSRVCDWKKIEDLVHVHADKADAPRLSEGESCPAKN